MVSLRAPALMACLVAVLLLPGSAAAQEAREGTAGAEAPPNWAYQMAHDLMSPYCPGRTLSACPSEQAAELRQWILFQAAAGQTREEIEASLHERFGAAILSAPKAEGWGLSAYVVPVLGFLLGQHFPDRPPRVTRLTGDLSNTFLVHTMCGSDHLVLIHP